MSRGAGVRLRDATGEEFWTADALVLNYWRAYGAEAAV